MFGRKKNSYRPPQYEIAQPPPLTGTMVSDGPRRFSTAHPTDPYVHLRDGYTDDQIARMEWRVVPPTMESYTPPNMPQAKLSSGTDSLASCFSQGGSHLIPLAQGLVWDPTKYQGHAITFGKTGGGKGVSAVNPAALSYAGNMLIFDPKGASAWETIPRRRQLGYKVILLDPWDEVNRRYGSQVGITEQTSSYNPLAYIDPASANFADDVTLIADALIIPNTRDPHWTDSAREFVSGLVAAVVQTAPGFATLGAVRKLIVHAEKELATKLRQVIDDAPDSLAADKLKRFADGTGDEIKSIKSTAQTQTAILDAVRLIASMETEEDAFDMAELASGRVTIFVILPLDKFQTHGRWLRLVLTMALKAVARSARPPALPILFVCDEMGTLGPLQALEEAYGLLRSTGVRCWSFVQDLSQLQRDYPSSWHTFIANSEVIQVIQASELVTTKYISETIGVRTEKKTSQQTRDLMLYPSVNKVVPKDRKQYEIWSSKQRERDDWEFAYYRKPNKGFPSWAKHLMHHPEHYYPGEWCVERTQFPADFSTRHDDFRLVPLLLPQQIADMPSELVLVLFTARGKYRLPRLIHHKEQGWRPYLRPDPTHDLQGALAYARSPPAPSGRAALPAPALALAPPSPHGSPVSYGDPMFLGDRLQTLHAEHRAFLRNWRPTPSPPRPSNFIDRWLERLQNRLQEQIDKAENSWSDD